MKTTLMTLLAFCLLSTVAAFAQLSGGYIDPQARPLIFPSHEQHAYEGAMLPERNLYVRTATAIAQGERPLWEFAQPEQEMPLGDIARLLRKEHASSKKAVMALEKQGR